MKNIGVLGCTGSIGTTTLRVIRDNNFRVGLLANHSDLDGLLRLIEEFHPQYAVCIQKKYLYCDGKEYSLPDDFLSRPETYEGLDIVVNGIVGIAGLDPTLAVLKSNAILATANKESFVCAGNIIKKHGSVKDGKIYPLDSEHSAIWQLIDGRIDVNKVTITASGGAFRDLDKNELALAKANDALRHPNWLMGKKVTIDCATLMNKGMELIEAKHLFNLLCEAIGHRESIIHAIAEYADGKKYVNMSMPTMYTPINYALQYPTIGKNDNYPIEYSEKKGLSFFELDEDKFPCLSIAKEVVKLGDKAGCVMNAANEVLVKKYLDGDISFYDIPCGITSAMEKFDIVGDFDDVESIVRIDGQVKEYTLSMSFGR